MGDILLLLAVIVMLAFGFVIVKHIGIFLDENQKNMDNEQIEPTCVMLTQDLDDEKIAEELRKFREKHESARIYLCSGENEKVPQGKS